MTRSEPSRRVQKPPEMEKGPLISQRPFAFYKLIFVFDSIRSARIRPALGARPLGKRVYRAADKIVRAWLRFRQETGGWLA
jgi:hypothetical protein